MVAQTLEIQTMKKASVVILNWNGSSMLAKFLPDIVRHTLAPDVEIVVADNGSTDDSLHVLANFPDVRVIRLERNYGFAEGYNRALEQVQAEYAVLLNSDVAVTSGWLAPLLHYLDTHPDTAACQPKILSYNEPHKFEFAGACGGFLDRWGYPYCRGRLVDHTETDLGQYDDICDVLWATGACLCIRMHDFQEVGGLDNYFFAHMEEIDLCWRLRCRGKRICCIPQSTVYHVGASTLKRENPFKIYLNFRNNLLMLYKNLPTKQLRKVMAVRFLLDYTAALQMLLTGKYANARAVCKARRDYRRARRQYTDLRQQNITHATVAIPDGISTRSILIDYYLRGMRK